MPKKPHTEVWRMCQFLIDSGLGQEMILFCLISILFEDLLDKILLDMIKMAANVNMAHLLTQPHQH